MKALRRGLVTFGTAAVVVGTVLGAGAAGAVPLPALPALPNGSLGQPPASKAQLNKSFKKLSSSMAKKNPGRIGIAITAGGGDSALSFGSLKSARAWSTLKVPVSIAAQRRNGTEVRPQQIKAITLSDNDAAEALWASLGGNRAAVTAVTGVLRDGHDSITRVSSQLDSPPSFPGYTDWKLTSQSIFAANLPCVPGSSEVLGLMGRVGGNQQWGVAKPKTRGVTSAVKGGWGPRSDATGKYVVRQLAVITTPRGTLGVSLAAEPASGSLGDGTAMLDRLGKWVLSNLGKLPAGTCVGVPTAAQNAKPEPEQAQPEEAQPQAQQPQAAQPETAEPDPAAQVQPAPAAQVRPAAQ
ncbi:hypothetical protein [Gordonia sp. VNK21]|uniref:hypothetical protein n=1 Tax=Gordonia sp. VNK21 TaxID=3382483 RepID=UPI0038D38E5C